MTTPPQRNIVDELNSFRTVIGILCLSYLGRVGWTASPSLSPVSTVLISMSASFVAVWLFSIKEGTVKLKLKPVELEGPACEVILWFVGVLVVVGAFAIATPKKPNQQALEPTGTAVTSAAEQPPRQP